MKILTVVGARPQFIKAAALSRELRKKHNEIIIHTGQHYDDNMSKIFFEELEIPQADYNLGVGSSLHGAQTGAMLERIELVLNKEKPDRVIVYGDTNSTLAGALAAAKMHIPVAHIEAGLRSYNRIMPEEINRVVTDHLSDILLCPSRIAVKNLKKEGIFRGVHEVGDIMLDALLFAKDKAKISEKILKRLKIEKKRYILATVHRSENTDNRERLENILRAFVKSNEVIVFPLHPRTKKMFKQFEMAFLLKNNVKIVEPVGYLDMIGLEMNARMILTDSGGIQKEAYWLKVPCITLRDETEWVETVTSGWNVLTGTDSKKILSYIEYFALNKKHPAFYGDGRTAKRCCKAMLL